MPPQSSSEGEALLFLFFFCKLALIMTGVRASRARTWFLISHVFIFPAARSACKNIQALAAEAAESRRPMRTHDKQIRRGREDERPRLSFARLTIALPDDPADDEPKRVKWRRHQEDGYLHKKCRRCRRKRRQEIKWSLYFKGLQCCTGCDH